MLLALMDTKQAFKRRRNFFSSQSQARGVKSTNSIARGFGFSCQILSDVMRYEGRERRICHDMPSSHRAVLITGPLSSLLLLLPSSPDPTFNIIIKKNKKLTELSARQVSCLLTQINILNTSQSLSVVQFSALPTSDRQMHLLCWQVALDCDLILMYRSVWTRTFITHKKLMIY